MKTFKELGLGESFLKNLEEMKITEPTEIQEKTIPLTMEGKDVVGSSATGSGKTLAFGACIIEKIQDNKLNALILTPTRELAEQVATSIEKFAKHFPVRVLPVYGGVSIEQQIRKIPHANIIVGTPGRILDHMQRGTINFSNLRFLVLDEVDRMFDMGFQRDVERIIYKCPKERQTMMFSATVTPEIDYLINKHTKNPSRVAVKSYVDASKLQQFYYDVDSREKFSLLVHLLKQENSEVVMVFCNTRRNADFVAKNLRLNGINSQVIHGGLTQNKRSNVLEEFHRGQTNVLVCTDVAARGLDIKGVSHVYNYDIPKTSQDYVHRIGRTARAGEEGKAISLLSQMDYENFRAVLKNESLKIKEIQKPNFEEVRVQTTERRFGNRNFRGNGRTRRFDRQRDNRNSRGRREDSEERGYNSRRGSGNRRERGYSSRRRF